MAMNNNPGGLAYMAENPKAAAAFLADRSTVFKSLLARMINQTSKVPAAIEPVMNQLSNPVLRSGALMGGLLSTED